MSYSEGIKKWGFYYIFVASAFLMFLVKRWMMKRMQKHLNYLEEQKKNKK
jgi:preprotein translocase subunit YajC